MAKIKNKKKIDRPKEKPSPIKKENPEEPRFPVAPDREFEETAVATSFQDPESSSAVPTTETESPVVEKELLELLSFRLADEEYAVDLLKIKEIIRLTEITYVPRAPNFIEGIISLRGSVIPIFDMRDRLGLKKRPPTRKSRIIIAKLQSGPMGFITDEVTDVMKVPIGEIESAPGAKEETEHLIGVIHAKDRMVIYMDMDQTVGMKAVKISQ